MKSKENHDWSKADDFVAFACYRALIDLKDAAWVVGVEEKVMKMRCDNFKFIDAGSDGLSHPSASTKKIFSRFKGKI